MNIVSFVQEALTTASSEQQSALPSAQLHKDRSTRFVEGLASLLRKHYRNQKEVAVLSQHFEGNRSRFGLNELLYDVLVCEMATTKSAVNQEELVYVTRGIWAIESEFERNSREALYDFNKLVLSSSENKLFIGPVVADTESFLGVLSGAAERCSANTFAVLVPHPSQWTVGATLLAEGYEWKESVWQPTTK